MRKILFLFLISCMVSFTAYAQQRTVSGTVTSSDDGQPVIGCTVQIKGTSTGIRTDAEGRFSLPVPVNATTLVFSYVGMKTLETEITGLNVVNVVLLPEVQSLSEVVVT